MHFTSLVLMAVAVRASSPGDMAHDIRGVGSGSVDLDVGDSLPLLLARQNSGGVAGKNLQTFTGALGGIKADAVTQTSDTQRPFSVDGSTFTDFQSAAGRSCDNQKNNCAKAANAGGNSGFSVSDCDTQNTQCKANINSANVAQSSQGTDTTTTSSSSSTSTSTTSTSSSFFLSTTSTSLSIASTTTSATLALVSQNAEFNFFCEV